MPKVSIVVLSYNRPQHLANNLLSISNQRYSDYEVIVSDAGSTENNIEVAESFADRLPELRIVSHQAKYNEDGHVIMRCSKTANHGLDYAQGEIVQFLQADHIISPLYLQHLVSLYSLLPRALVPYGAILLGLCSYLPKEVEARDVEALSNLEFAPGTEEWPDYPRWARFYGHGLHTLVPCPDWRAIDGFDFAIQAAACERFDEDFSGQGHEHMDFIYRMAKKGMIFLSTPLLRHYHQPHEEIRPETQWNEELAVSTDLFTKKHGGEAWAEQIG